MTQDQLNQSGFIFIANSRSIEPITYRDYLNEYGKDLTTSPRGVEDRMHIREKEVETSFYNELTEEDEADFKTEWQIWSWGTNGNHPHYTGTSFDNEEDAELYYYERSEWYIQEKNWDAPRWCSTHDEAVTEFSNSLDKSEDVVRRYLKISAITERKAAEHRAEITRQTNQHKTWLAIEVPKEANSIAIDDEFKKLVKEGSELTGSLKSAAMAAAMKGLLSRNNIELIKSDFWQVFRILKARSENQTL